MNHFDSIVFLSLQESSKMEVIVLVVDEVE